MYFVSHVLPRRLCSVITRRPSFSSSANQTGFIGHTLVFRFRCKLLHVRTRAVGFRALRCFCSRTVASSHSLTLGEWSRRLNFRVARPGMPDTYRSVLSNGWSSTSDYSTHSSVSDSNMSLNNSFQTVTDDAKFEPKKVLVLAKLTRYEFEKRRHSGLSDVELEAELNKRGSDYQRLLKKHNEHNGYVETISREMESRGVECRIVRRWEYTEENIAWADAVLTAGGDGTFLMAASKIRDGSKPVIGINTDPVSSEGYLCLTKKLPMDCFKEALNRLFGGDFSWLWRQRIRVILSGRNAFDEPIELHDQQLMYPEYRWSEHVREQEEVRHRTHSKVLSRTASESSSGEPYEHDEPESNTLPYLALNDVFIGESLSSRVSYYELCIDDGVRYKQKSSGITVCTGTGSTSWYFNINKLTQHCVQDLLRIVNGQLGSNLPVDDDATVNSLCQKFNSQLIYDASDLRMAYTVRDPVFNATFPAMPPRGFAQSVIVKSRCYDAHLVIDGGMSYVFNDGSRARLEIRPEDALRTVVFR